ncbi:MAG: winged helix-turn-helix domain-containing protein [Gammaproteobacteria bacterium]
MADENRSPSRFQIGDLILDTGAHTLTRNGDEIQLTRLSFALLATLVRHAPKLMTQDELLTEVWGKVVVSDEALKQRVKVLRQAIGDVSDSPRYVVSVRGLGYRLIAPVKVLSDERPLDAGETRQTAPSFSRITFVKELQRRHMFRAAAIYVVVAWGATEILRFIFEQLPFPLWAAPLTAIIFIVGFPVTMILAWHFDVTLDGIRPTPASSVKDQLTILQSVVLLIVATVGLFYLIYPRAVTQTAEETRVAIPEVPKNSIAVLPFINLSDDASNEYFSDGISEELLKLLTKIPELRVISRTSAFSYKGRGIDLPTIAEQLNVAHVLEGSVRKAGNQVRITAQLIEARSDTHLWSETYERTLDDIFATQDEIAARVVEQLKVTLLGDAPTAQATDSEAYALVLQARYLGRQNTPDAYEKSIALFEQALAIDPDYAAAWDGLARGYMNQAGLGLRPIDEGYTLAREAASQALALDPAYAPAHLPLARIARDYDRDLVTAARHNEQALAMGPANTDSISDAATLVTNLGRLDQAIALAKYAAAHDPVNPIRNSNLGLLYLDAGRLDEAIASLRTTLTLSPGYIGAQYFIGAALLLKGEPKSALAAMQKEADEGWRLIGLVMAHHALGQAGASDVALAKLIEKYEQDAAYNIAYVLAFRDEADRAFEWLNKAVAYKDPGLSDIAVWPYFANIQLDPRWLPFLESIGRSPEQLAAIEFKVTLPE